MTTNSTNDVGRAFLRWLEVHAEEHPNPGDFLDEQPTIDGQPITQAELTKAVLRAEDHEMIKGGHGNESDMPFRVRLLPAGQLCLDDFDGDMRKWAEAQRGSAIVTNDYSVSVNARDHVQVVAHAQDVMQNMTVGSVNGEQLRDVGTAAQEIADILPRPIQEDVAQAGRDLVVAADDPENIEQVKTAGERLLSVLTASSASLTIVRFVLDALGIALGGHS